MHSLPSHLWPWPQPSSIVLIQQGSHCHCCPQTCQAVLVSGLCLYIHLPAPPSWRITRLSPFLFRLDFAQVKFTRVPSSATKLTWIKCNFIKNFLYHLYSNLFTHLCFLKPFALLTYIYFLSFLISSKHKLPKSKDLICLFFTLLPMPKKFIVGTQ